MCKYHRLLFRVLVASLFLSPFWSGWSQSVVLGEVANGVVEDVQVYNAASAEWLHKVAMKCTYELNAGTAIDWESALRGEFNGKTEKITGTMVKLGQMVRYSQVYPGGPVSVNGDLHQQTNVSTETLIKPGLRLRGSFDYPSRQLEENEGDDEELNLNSVPHDINPLSITGAGVLGSPIRSLLRKTISVASSSVETTPEGQIVISASTHVGNEKSVVKIRLDVSHGYPICERYERVTEVKPDVKNVYVVWVGDWRDCGGVLVPGKIVYCFKRQEGASDKGISLKVWESKDLGRELPLPSDFVVKVPPRTPVQGVKDYPVMSPVERELDFNSLGIGSIGKAGDAVPEAAGASKWLLRLVLFGLVVVGVAIATWRRWKRAI